MIHQEKKYLVDSFIQIRTLLDSVGAKKTRDVTSIHYYGEHESNDVEKFVEYPDHLAIHILKESDGTFTLLESIPITSKDDGLAWLKLRGYTIANIVRMIYSEYAYNNGKIGLYTIDGIVHSVILDFPVSHLKSMETKFGLESSEVISLPFNKYLQHIGHLRSMRLS